MPRRPPLPSNREAHRRNVVLAGSWAGVMLVSIGLTGGASAQQPPPVVVADEPTDGAAVYEPDTFLSDGEFLPDEVSCTDGGFTCTDGSPGDRAAFLTGRTPRPKGGARAGRGAAGNVSDDNVLRRWFGGPFVVSDRGYVDPNDPDRHTGLGEPLIGTSWRNRPFSVSAFVGGQMPATPVDNVLRQRGGTAFGYRVSYDFDHYVGVEFRHTILTTKNELLGITAPNGNAIRSQGFSQAADVMAYVYPWGDTRWRPYFGAGIGIGSFELIDAQSNRYRDTTLTMPLAAGVKYQLFPWLAVRAEVSDILEFGGATIDPENFVNLNIGTEFRFGAKRRKYYPLDSSYYSF